MAKEILPAAAVLIVNKHKRLVAVRAENLCRKLGTGVYDWPKYDAMSAAEVKKCCERVGVKYGDSKEKAIAAIEKTAMDAARAHNPLDTSTPEGRKRYEHPNYELMRVQLERLGVIK